MERISNHLTVEVLARDLTRAHVYTVPCTPLGEWLWDSGVQTVVNIDDGQAPLIIKVLWMKSQEDKAPTEAELSVPVLRHGYKYVPGIMSGTASKGGDMLYVRSDIVDAVEKYAPAVYAEDVQKIARALIPTGGYGALRGALNVQTVENGTVGTYGIVEDGISYLRESVYARLGIAPEQLIRLGRTRMNVQLWQHLDDNVEMRAELGARFVSFIRELGSKAAIEVAMDDGDEGLTGWRGELIGANPAMAQHPLLVSGASAAFATLMAEKAANPDIDARGMLAVPSIGDELVLPKGEWMIARNPGQSSIAATVHTCTGAGVDDNPAFRRYVAGLVITLTAKSGISLKTLAVVVPDDMMPQGVDMVASADNVKLGLAGAKEPKVLALTDAVLSVILAYDAKSFVGLPYHQIWKPKAGDFDGDNAVVVSMKGMPGYTQALREAGERRETNYKTEKSKSPIGLRTAVIANAMSNVLGLSVVLRGGTWVLPEEDREDLVSVGAAVWPGTASWGELQGRLTAAIQEQVDSFKSLACDTQRGRKALLKFNGGLNRMTGGMPGWLRWKRVDGVFKQFFPAYPRPESVPGMTTEAWKKTPAFKAGVGEGHAQCAVGRLFEAKYSALRHCWEVLVGAKDRSEVDLFMFEMYAGVEAREALQAALDRFDAAKDVAGRPEMEAVLPLPSYVGWAPLSSKEDMEVAKGLLPRFSRFRAKWEAARQAGSYDPSDPVDVAARNRDWIVTVEAFCREKSFSAERMAAALWRVVHAAERSGSGETGAVFMGFPKQCMAYAHAAAQSGAPVVRCKLVGVQYTYPDMPSEINATVEIRMVAGNLSPFALETRTGSCRCDPRDSEKGFAYPTAGSMYKMTAKRIDLSGRYIAEFVKS